MNVDEWYVNDWIIANKWFAGDGNVKENDTWMTNERSWYTNDWTNVPRNTGAGVNVVLLIYLLVMTNALQLFLFLDQHCKYQV